MIEKKHRIDDALKQSGQHKKKASLLVEDCPTTHLHGSAC
jgi:hypothetical protein